MRCLIIILFLFLNQQTVLNAQEVREYLDLQMHPTMHMIYPFFGDGFTYFEEGEEPNLKYKHQFKNVNYANYWTANEGARIIVHGALTKENIKDSDEARRIILDELSYVNEFAKNNSEDFVVAKSPQEVRTLLQTTDKTIIIHSIEGGKKLINSQEDANFWAAQGISFITLIHLVDSDLGTSAIKPGFMMKLINLRGAIKKEKKRGGLTEKGKNAIKWMANAGIMTDITHMADQTRIDALKFMEENNIPPISTHDLYRPIQNHPRGISREQIIQIYQNNGFISLPISGISLEPYRSETAYIEKIDSLECYCNGSIDTYKFTYLEVKKLIESNFKNIDADYNETANFEDLSESDKVQFSIGFQSDFNGWLSHSKPRYGKDGCYPMHKDSTYLEIETKGLAHPGLLEEHWNLLTKEGVDLAPIQRNSEKFLQLWEFFLSNDWNF